MSNYSTTKAAIDSNIVPHNNTQDITGQKLNDVLKLLVDNLGDGYRFAGVVTSSTAAITTDNKVFVIARDPGIYTNFGNLECIDGEIAIFKYDTTWTKSSPHIPNLIRVFKMFNAISSLQSGGAIKRSDGGINVGSSYHSDYWKLKTGVDLFLYGASSSTSTLCAYYDDNKDFIQAEPDNGNNLLYRTAAELEAIGAKYIRMSVGSGQGTNGRWFLVNGMPQQDSKIFEGKRVSIIGDSISCFGTQSQTRTDGYNAPFWIVKDIDVGQQVQSWVTWLDVYQSVDGTTPIHKTIGGQEITAAMIGTKQTFTPIAEDVGKAIGVPRWAGSYTSSPWWQVFIDKTGALLCNNASWSGSRMCEIPEGSSRHDAFVLSEAYSEYTLGRVANRDDAGNVIEPDIIMIYRGANDFSASDPEGSSGVDANEDLTTPDMMTFTGITDPQNFTQAYIWTILKLRERYPNAFIVCCTLNVFKRRNYSHFPTNNGTYTLPQYNDKIREIANLMGCGLIEFDKDGITFENCYSEGYITDSSTQPLHPNTKGHKVMGRKAVADMRYILNE